jgi:hypothetical protein
MIGSIAQGYATRALISLTGKILQSGNTGEGSTTRNVSGASAGGSATAPDTLTISGRGKLLAENQLLLPTASNIQALSAALSHNMSTLFTSAGISSTSCDIDVDERTMEITVKGDGSERAAIQKVIDGSEEIKNQIRTLAAISSHAAGMADSLKFQKEYAASTNPESVVSKYAALFGQKATKDISLHFDGTAVTVLANGKDLLTSLS